MREVSEGRDSKDSLLSITLTYPDISSLLASLSHVPVQGLLQHVPPSIWVESLRVDIHRHKQEQSKKLSVSHLKSSGSLHCFNRLRSQGSGVE